LLGPLETLLTVIWSLLFLQERLSVVQWAGGGLILFGAVLAGQRMHRIRWRPRLRL
ncbi:MAG: EamA family transporter, partial [Chloroflexi bacterium]|nr:EamA family transporter [Chloroflexota bacterium]